MHLDLDDIDQQLTEIGPVWARIQEYRLTMGYLHVELRDNDYSKRADIYLHGCLFICGPTQGGPWQFRVTEIHEDNQTAIKVSGGGDMFFVKGIKIALSIPGEDG